MSTAEQAPQAQNSDSLPDYLDSSCLACGFHGAIPLFDGGMQPLATLGWPDQPAASLGMQRLRLDFIRCLRCGHIYNRAFEYLHVPYAKHPNLMYNASTLWQVHQQEVCRRLAEALPPNPTVIEIGCGEGGFLKRLAAAVGQGQFIGFDPNSSADLDLGYLQLKPELFIPKHHLQTYQPDLILSRHVLEHLNNPLAFIQELAFFSSWARQRPKLFFEVPCVDRLVKYGRLEDLYFEHNSHFTSHSFRSMLTSLPCQIEFIEHGYNEEVLCGLIQLETLPGSEQILAETRAFREQSLLARRRIPAQIAELLAQGRSLAFWGGTGKGAAFVHHFGLDATQTPLLVVDSDASKVGTFVPGTPYRIESAQCLLETPAQVIIIPAQWRAQDVVLEIAAAGIAYQQILIEHQGVLVDFFADAHPYRISAESPQP